MKMKNIVLFIILSWSIKTVAQTGKVFPLMAGVLLDGKIINLPLKNGKFTVVAIAYNRNAEEELKQWLNPLYNLFIVKKESGSNFDMAEIYDVNFVFIPLISGFKKIANDFKAGTDKEFWPYIMDTDKTDIIDVQKQLKVSDNKIPYFYVLDKSGKIVEVQSGNFTEEKLDKIEDAIE